MFCCYDLLDCLAIHLIIVILSSSVFITLSCIFRYGREDLDVLGLSFRKDLFVSTLQVFPPLQEDRKPLSHLQERLMKKLGSKAYPFSFSVNITINQHTQITCTLR